MKIPKRALWFAAAAALIIGVHSNADGAAGMAFDPSGNLFLVGANPSRIFKFSPDGAVAKFAEAKTAEEDWRGIGIDSHGNVFVATDATDRSGDVITRILKFTPAGKRSVFVASVAKGQAKALAMDRDGNLFVGVVSVTKFRGPDGLYKITPDGQRKNVFTTAIEDPTFLAFDNANNIFVYDESRKISKLAPNGKEIASMKTGDVYDLACDVAGNLFIALPHDNEIAKIAPDGTKSQFATDVDPWFLAIDKDGNIFALANGIEKFSPDGKRTQFAANPIK